MRPGSYLTLFKPRICSLVAFCAIAGLFAAGARAGSVTRAAFLAVSTMLASASASAFNHYFDRDIDRVMERTSRRPLCMPGVSPPSVLAAAVVLFLASVTLSFHALNFMVSLHLSLGAFVYAVVYTVWLKRRSRFSVVIGGLAGSFAVLAGGASENPGLCAPPAILAAVIFFWTPSHFWAFAICHREEYGKAGVPMLPAVVGDERTALYILINTMLLAAASFVPFFMGHSGWIYMAVAVVMGAYFILWNVRLLKRPGKDVAWKNFKVSMLYLGILFTSAIIDMTV